MEQAALPFDSPPLRRCVDCGDLKPASAYHRNRFRKDGLQRRCRDCNIDVAKRWHADNGDLARARINTQTRAMVRWSQELVYQYLRSHPCVDCGERNPILLDFDHLRDKVANVSAMAAQNKPWPDILQEIEKCEVRCANCHRLRTAERLPSYRLCARTASSTRPSIRLRGSDVQHDIRMR